MVLTNSLDITTLVRVENLNTNCFFVQRRYTRRDEKTALYQVGRGNYYIGNKCKHYFKKHSEQIEEVEYLLNNMSNLTKSERKVLSKMSENLSTNEIADQLLNSTKTIINNKTNISKKLEITSYNNLQYL